MEDNGPETDLFRVLFDGRESGEGKYPSTFFLDFCRNNASLMFFHDDLDFFRGGTYSGGFVAPGFEEEFRDSFVLAGMAVVSASDETLVCAANCCASDRT